MKAKLTRLDQGGPEEGQRRQIIITHETVHLGRSRDIRKLSEWLGPLREDEARLPIYINSPDNHISQNHALIVPPDRTGDPFVLVDLASAQGTSLNGHRLSAFTGAGLAKGDVVNLGGSAIFEFTPMAAEPDSNIGVMVGHRGGNLPLNVNNVLELKEQFELRGFRNQIVTLFDDHATSGRILREVESAKEKMTEDSTFLFYFTGHGNLRGELILDDSAGGKDKLTPEALMKALKDFRGKILVILDGCHTFAMAMNPLVPANAAVVGHEGVAFYGAPPRFHEVFSETTYSQFKQDIFHGYTSRALYNKLKKDPSRMEIKRVVEAIQGDADVKMNQKVRLHGGIHLKLPTAHRIKK